MCKFFKFIKFISLFLWVGVIASTSDIHIKVFEDVSDDEVMIAIKATINSHLNLKDFVKAMLSKVDEQAFGIDDIDGEVSFYEEAKNYNIAAALCTILIICDHSTGGNMYSKVIRLCRSPDQPFENIPLPDLKLIKDGLSHRTVEYTDDMWQEVYKMFLLIKHSYEKTGYF